MGHHRQFSLATLLLGTTGVGVAFALLPYPFVAFYVLLAFFFCTAILSRIGPVEARSFWRWFSFSGWLYVFLGPALLDAIEMTAFWRTTGHSLQFMSTWRPEHYLMFAHSLTAIGVAISGGVLIPRINQARRLH